MLAVGVVEENAVAGAFAQSQHESECLIKRIGGLLPAVSIGVPHGERLIAMIERSGFIAEAKIVLVLRHRFGDGEIVAHPTYGGGIASNENTVVTGERESRVAPIDIDAQCRC